MNLPILPIKSRPDRALLQGTRRPQFLTVSDDKAGPGQPVRAQETANSHVGLTFCPKKLIFAMILHCRYGISLIL